MSEAPLDEGVYDFIVVGAGSAGWPTAMEMMGRPAARRRLASASTSMA